MNTQKIALVTGGTGGIGTAICIALAEQGRKVIAGYFPPEADAAEAWQARHRDNGYDFEIVACDVSDFESSKTMLHDVEKNHWRCRYTGQLRGHYARQNVTPYDA